MLMMAHSLQSSTIKNTQEGKKITSEESKKIREEIEKLF